MLIRQIRLWPFAGVSDRQIKFTHGLNVVVGPNEAGKSTLVQALQAVLFAPTKVGKRDWDSKLKRFVPIGGDTFRVTLEFSAADGQFTLQKSWGEQPHTELTLPGGQIITDPKTAETRLESVLGLRQGTWENILFAHQTNIRTTIQEINHKSSETNDLAQILRHSRFTTDGVSIESLGQLIERRLNGLLSRWDEQLQCPEKNRGIDNPWQNNVGDLLDAWYSLEGIRRQRDRAEEFERKQDDLTSAINHLAIERDDLQKKVEELKPIVEDAQKRQSLERKLVDCQEELKELKRVFQDWPEQVKRADVLGKDLTKIQTNLDSLTDELDDAKAFEQKREKLRQLQVAQKKAKELETASKTLESKKSISADQLEELTSLENERARLEASLSAGQLKVKIAAVTPLDIQVQRDLKEETHRTILPDEPVLLEAGGRITLRHCDWSISVESGEADFEQLEESYQRTTNDFKKLLESLEVENVEQARRVYREYRDAAQDLQRLKDTLDDILDGTSIEELTKEVGIDDQEPAPRAIDIIATEKVTLENELKTQTREKKEIETCLAEWSEKYESNDKLLDLLADKRSTEKSLEQGISVLKPLPDDVTDIDGFLTQFEAKKDRLNVIKADKLPQLKIQQAELERNAPEESLQELDEALRDADQAFNKVKADAAALKRVRDVYQRLRADLDSGTLDPWIERLQTVLTPLTGGRYRDVSLEANEATRVDNASIPYGFLSVGTQACFSLAIRLSMASYFLDGRDGVLLLDDPLVDLDPERQLATAEILTEFARDKQVVVFTCHPQHAQLLNANPIILERTA